MGNLNEIIGLIDRHDVDGLFLTVVPVFTNLTIQATRSPPIRNQTRNYRLYAHPPDLQAVPRTGQFLPVNTGFDVLINESRLYNSDLFRRWAPCLAG